MFDFQVLGTQIVQELSSLIDKRVLVTDKNGFVIASLDPERLNTFHEGAALSMKKQQEIHMTEEMCRKLKGVRPGIVMPIIISNTPIGVIGITGKPAEVEKYAKLVKKVAELFINDFMSRQEKERGVREVEFFFFDLITTTMDKESIVDRAKMINIDISLYRRVAVIQTHQQMELSDVEDFLHIQTLHPDLKIVRWGLEKMVLLLPNISKNKVIEGLKNLAAKIQKRVKRKISVGVGKEMHYYNLKESFAQAEMAVEVSARQDRIVFEEDLKLELLYYSLPKDVQEEFLRRTLTPLLEEKELLYNLEVWINKKKSLKDVAEELHIHKNTLNYRLGKIEKILGMDLTDSEDLVILYTALRLLRKK